jgi:hypothetical protein
MAKYQNSGGPRQDQAGRQRTARRCLSATHAIGHRTARGKQKRGLAGGGKRRRNRRRRKKLRVEFCAEILGIVRGRLMWRFGVHQSNLPDVMPGKSGQYQTRGGTWSRG